MINTHGLTKWAIENGGSIHPLIVDAGLTGGTGLANPTILVENDRVIINLRHLNYTLHHSERSKYNHHYGPLQYLHPENDHTLKTNNFIMILDHEFNVVQSHKVDTSRFDQDPLWLFVGLEDARLMHWNNRYYLCGVRRDTTTNGQGRMELSEIDIQFNSVTEVSRFRIPAPGPDSSYCEKNWMPVLDQPYTFVKWCNPTEVVKVDVDAKTCVTTHLDETTYKHTSHSFRGSSQVFLYKDHYWALIHESDLYNDYLGRKNATYRHRFLKWDRTWNLVGASEKFSFMQGEIEFCAGAALHGNDLLITYGFQDNSAYLLRMPLHIMESIVDIPWN
jgi:hypothetical protein